MSAPRRRVVLLGASNLTLGLPLVVRYARRAWGEPVSVLAALGHGRSYGTTSSVFFRRLPGILHCGLWDALAATTPAPTVALITDVGNDLLYGAEVADIAAWVDACLARLEAAGARSAVTLLPTANLADLSERRFRFFMRLFMPRCGLSLNEVAARVAELSTRVEQLAAKRGAHVVAQRREWYGVDPMHFGYIRRARVWDEILSSWLDEHGSLPRRRFAPWEAAYLHALAPERRWIFSRERRRAQPAGLLRDGTTVALY